MQKTEIEPSTQSTEHSELKTQTVTHQVEKKEEKLNQSEPQKKENTGDHEPKHDKHEGHHQAHKHEEFVLSVPSKKIQINSFEHELCIQLKGEHISKATVIRIEGNSYSTQFCLELGTLLKSTPKLHSLNINDIFVSRLKEQIPQSIEHISGGLLATRLQKLDISNNAVNPYGAKALLTFLKGAENLKVLLISNCGLGTLGVKQIAEGLKFTKNLRTLSIGRNRMENAGIIYLSESIPFIPLLQELYIYQNTLRSQGLTPLIKNLIAHSPHLSSFDLCDNFLRDTATAEMCNLIQKSLSLKSLNLSDCLNEGQNEQIVIAFQKTSNHNFIQLGFNYIELTAALARRLLSFLKQCPLKKLQIIGNDLPKTVRQEYRAVYDEQVLRGFEDQDEDQVTRLFQEMKI